MLLVEKSFQIIYATYAIESVKWLIFNIFYFYVLINIYYAISTVGIVINEVSTYYNVFVKFCNENNF